MIGLIDNGLPTPPQDYFATLINSVFQPDGLLQSTLALEHRPQQEAMAVAVTEALEMDGALLFEAGTGVGKSLAYLIPGIIRAVDSGRPLIVSSHTIALQEQLYGKDLKICRQLFAETEALKKYAGFKSAIMVGKGNYCCGSRLKRSLEESRNPHQQDMFEPSERSDLERVAEWIGGSKEGTRQELSPPVSPDLWERINADSSLCSRKNCTPDTCPYQRAKSRLEKADIIIVNHSLLFALIGAGAGPKADERGILFPDDAVVLDEAHRVPAIATEYFGLGVSSYSVRRGLLALYNPQKEKGFIKRLGSHYDIASVKEALAANDEFFANLNENVLRKRSLLRITEPDICLDVLSEPLQNVVGRLAALLQREDDERVRDEIQDYVRRLNGVRQGIANFLALEDKDHVYWIERTGSAGKIISLRSAPLDVAPYLRTSLFGRNTAAILTSATLSDGTSMDSFRRQVGADGAAEGIRTSPFDYKKNCRIYLATDAPEPNRKQGNLDLDYLAEMIQWAALRCDGGTLVLCTSYSDLQALYKRLVDPLQEEGRTVYGQGFDYGRTELVERFKRAQNALLLGTDSFWTGIDIPGPALSQVIITRLPFENPGHPVVEARTEYIRERGGNPFVDMTLADALIKFRQGIGRLIRTAEDKGSLMLLDSRIARRPYGRAFIAALPHGNIVRFNQANRDSIVHP